jgi:hypothetical protein
MNFLTRTWLSLAIIGSSVVWQDISSADLTSPANPILLTENSDVIVVGRIIKAELNEYSKPKPYVSPGYIASRYSSSYQQIGDGIFTIKVDRSIKGTSVGTINCSSPIFLGGDGAAGVSEKAYGLFFLKRNLQGNLVATDAMHLGVITAPKLFISKASSSDIGSVTTEIANVLATPASLVIDPSSGVGSVNLPVSNSDVFKAESVYDKALNSLFYFPASIRLPLLRKVAQGSGELGGRLLATSAALKDGDDTLLSKFVPLLMKPNPNIGSLTLLRLESGIQSI